MKKNILSLCLLSCFTASAFAAQCPAPSDFIHVKGQPWRLSQHATAQGWDLLDQSDFAINSDLTSLPGEVELYLTVTSTGGVGCAYYLGSTVYDTLVAMPSQFADVKSLSMPPFYYHGEDNYACEITAATSSICQWKWKS